MDFLPKFVVKKYGGQPVAVAQVKFDGYYVEVYKSKGIPSLIFVCTKKQKVNLWPKLKSHTIICRQLESLPNETILRCELHAINVPATSVPTLTNNADSRLLLSPFKIEMWGGDVYSRTSFNDEYHFLRRFGFVVPEIRGIWIPPQTLDDRVVESYKEEAKKSGIEGYVLKDYQGNCWKIKSQKTIDAFVVGYEISDSDSFAGGLKSVDIAVFGPDGDEEIIASVGTGFAAGYRMSVDLKTLVDKIGEFKYQQIGAKGRLIFPRFLRWRDDEKKKSECSFKQFERSS